MQTWQPLQHRWVRWCLYLGFWTLLGLCNVCQAYIDRRAIGRPCVWPERLVAGLSDWYVWAAITPFILRLARRFPFERPTWPRSLALHAVASVLAGLLVATCLSLTLWVGGGEPYQTWTLGKNLSELIFGPFFIFYLWIYWAIVGFRQAWDFNAKYRERDLQASRLAAQLAQAELQTLKTQLQPHFLFNTLNAITALMHQDVELADRMLARLGELLRRTLDNAGVQEVRLREEIEFLKPYLEIEQARYGERLRVRLDIEDAAVDAWVPNLILQPLVENAIRHGIAPRAEGGQVDMRARRRQHLLEVQVRDDGPGLPEEPSLKLREGLGLANTRGPDSSSSMGPGTASRCATTRSVGWSSRWLSPSARTRPGPRRGPRRPMVPIRTLIVDDEPLARQRLRTLLQDEPDVEVLGECHDGREAIAAIRRDAPDLVFLDVQMPAPDGFGVIQAVGVERMPPLIFVTAYDCYALHAFEVQALDYLLKPFDRERFRKALGRARSHVERARTEDLGDRLAALLDGVRSRRKPADRLVIKAAGRVLFLPAAVIDWVEAAGNYLRLHVGKEVHLLRMTMNALEARLDPDHFFRIHRSTLVNMDRVREIQPLFHGDYVVILQDGAELTLSRGYRQQLQRFLGP